MTLVFDNDGGYWEYNGEIEISEKQEEELCELYKRKYGEPDGYSDVVNIINAIGINADWC